MVAELFYLRLLTAMFTLVWIAVGILYRIFKEDAGNDDPTHYWLWFQAREPYISDADARVAHVQFKSKLLLTAGIPLFLLTLFLPDFTFEIFGWPLLIISLGTLLILYIAFIADAIDKNQPTHYAMPGITEADADLIKQLEEQGKLEED